MVIMGSVSTAGSIGQRALRKSLDGNSSASIVDSLEWFDMLFSGGFREELCTGARKEDGETE